MPGEKYTQADLLRRGAEESKKYTDKKTGDLAGEIGHINDDLSLLDSNVPKIHVSYLSQRNILDLATLTNEILNADGTVTANDTYRTTKYEIVEENATYRFWRWGNNRQVERVAYFDKDKNFISFSFSQLTIDVPANAYYARFCNTAANFSADGSPIISMGTEYKGDTIYENRIVDETYRYKTSVSTMNEPSHSWASALTRNGIFIDSCNSKKNNAITFTANISGSWRVSISHGKAKESLRSAILTVDEAKVSVYLDSETFSADYEHGLNITDFLDVTIIIKNFVADVYVSTSTGTFKVENVVWNGCKGNVMCEETGGGTISNVDLRWHVADFEHDLWVFGDSYLDFWARMLINSFGYDGYYLDGYGGRGSVDALKSMEKALQHYVPNKVLWCMGMNDPDTETAINASYKETYDKLVEICKKNGIELILCTIPNTPLYNHSHKNAIVKSSGYRYVDVCHAVGADVNTSWYEGLLNNDDKIHPSDVLGKAVLTHYMMASVPELLN